MSPYVGFWLRPVMVGLAIAGLRNDGLAADYAAAATLPKDPCAIFKPAEIQSALDLKAEIGSGVSDSSMLPLGVACTYTWGPRTSGWGHSALTITVMDASKAWPGVSPGDLKQGMLAKAKTSGPNASVIPGVGDVAIFTFEARSSNGMAEAYFSKKAIYVSVTFHDGDSLQDKGKIIALLKEAETRL